MSVGAASSRYNFLIYWTRGIGIEPTSAQPEQAQQQSSQGTTLEPQCIVVVSSTPVLGTGIEANKLPSSVKILKAKDLEANGGPPSLTNAPQVQVDSVNLNSTFGNP